MSFGKPEVRKEDVAGGITPMSELLREREKIGADLDELIDLIGDAYRRLSDLQREIGRRANHPPAWVADKLTGEIVTARLAMEIAPHSAGSAGESSVGPVTWRDSIQSTFQKNHAGGVAERS